MLAVAFVDLPTNHLVSPATNLHFSLQSHLGVINVLSQVSSACLGPDSCFCVTLFLQRVYAVLLEQ